MIKSKLGCKSSALKNLIKITSSYIILFWKVECIEIILSIIMI